MHSAEPPGGGAGRADRSAIRTGGDAQPYELGRRTTIIRGSLPTLEVVHDRFLRMFRLTLSSALRRVVDIEIASTELIRFEDFLKSLAVPTSLNLFRMQPLRGNGLMVMDSRLVYRLIHLFLGGQPEQDFVPEPRDYSAIEQRFMRRVVESAVEDLQFSWQPVFPLQLSYTRSEVNPQFVAIVPASEVVVLTTFTVDAGQEPLRFSLCIPYSTLEPLGAVLRAGHRSGLLQDKSWAGRLRERVEGAPLQLTARRAGRPITAAQLLQLVPGDVLMGVAGAGAAIDVLANGRRRWRGAAVSDGARRAVRVESVEPPDPPDPLKQLRAEAQALAEQAQQARQAAAGAPPEGAAPLEETAPRPLLDGLSPTAAAGLISFEHPQTIAAILAHLPDAQRTAQVLEALPDALQPEVALRIATLDPIQPGIMEEIAMVLAREAAHAGDQGVPPPGGAKAVAEVLTALGPEMTERLLAGMEQKDPAAAQAVRAGMGRDDESADT